MSKSATFFRRRSFIINKKLQYGLLATAYAYVALIVVVVAFSLFFPLMLDIGKGGVSADQGVLASRFILFLHENLWPPLLFALVAIAFHSVMISHRIAGPLHRIALFFREINDGILPGRIRLRKGDYLSEEVEDINKAMDVLKTRFGEIKIASEDLARYVQSNKDLLTTSEGAETLEELKGFSERVKVLEKKVGRIRIAD